MEHPIWVYILLAAIAYVIGSVSFSYILTKKVKKEDIREKGSGNAGTTNVLRNYGWALGLLTLVGDILKGVAAAFIGLTFGGEIGLYVAAVFVIVGHNFSCFLKFKGGKGVAATTGVLLIIQPIPTLIIFGFAVLIVCLTKMMSVGSIIGFILSAVVTFFVAPGNFYCNIAVVIICLMGILSHKENILRLVNGTENKLSLSKKQKNA